MARGYVRDPALVERDLERIRAKWPHEASSDPSRGELRLAAEVAFARLRGITVPDDALTRGLEVLSAMARG